MLVRSPNGLPGPQRGAPTAYQLDVWCDSVQVTQIKQGPSATGKTGLPGSLVGEAISSAVVSIRVPCLFVLKALLRVLNSTLPASRHCETSRVTAT